MLRAPGSALRAADCVLRGSINWPLLCDANAAGIGSLSEFAVFTDGTVPRSGPEMIEG